MNKTDSTRRKRLLYQAQHRGFKEADLILGSFAAASLSAMSAGELDEFETLLALPDHDLYLWVTGGGAAPAELIGPVFRCLRAFDVSKITAPRN